MFNWKKPTVEMLGRWQPWHDGHTAIFKKALKIQNGDIIEHLLFHNFTMKLLNCNNMVN